MSETPGPKAIQEFVDSLEDAEAVDEEVGRVIARLHDEGRLNAVALVGALREMRPQNDQDATAAES